MLEQQYRLIKQKKILLILIFAISAALLSLCFTTIGMEYSAWQTVGALKAYFQNTLSQGPDTTVNKIILLLRLPRIAMAVLAGAGLAISGVIMQSVTRNPLVSPFTLGLSSAAAFGASLAIVFGSGPFWESEAGIITCAFISALICALTVYAIAKKIGISPTVIVLVGISLNYLFSALTATVEFFAKQHKLEAVVQWTFGTFNKSTWDSITVCSAVVLLCLILIMQYTIKLDAIAANDDETVKSLGIDPQSIRTITVLASVLITAAIISFTGVIGFVGLIAPHMARLMIGGQHTYLIPFTGILGAILLLCADTAGRLILYPVSIPVGIIISFLGVPLFVHLILSANKEELG